MVDSVLGGGGGCALRVACVRKVICMDASTRNKTPFRWSTQAFHNDISMAQLRRTRFRRCTSLGIRWRVQCHSSFHKDSASRRTRLTRERCATVKKHTHPHSPEGAVRHPRRSATGFNVIILSTAACLLPFPTGALPIGLKRKYRYCFAPQTSTRLPWAV